MKLDKLNQLVQEAQDPGPWVRRQPHGGWIVTLHDAGQFMGMVGPFDSMQQAKQFMDSFDHGFEWDVDQPQNPVDWKNEQQEDV